MDYPSSRLEWGRSWTWGPPPDQPYVPVSGNTLAHSQSGANFTSNGPLAPHDVPSNGFGAGSRNSLTAYWFNMTGAFVQCDYSHAADGQPCTFYASPWKYDAVKGADVVQGASKSWTETKCTTSPCHLNKIDDFGPEFEGLSAVSFYAVIAGVTVDFCVDSLQMGWYNNTCEAGRMRLDNGR